MQAASAFVFGKVVFLQNHAQDKDGSHPRQCSARVYMSSEKKVCPYNEGPPLRRLHGDKLESAHISFGLVTIPVGIYSASRSRTFILTSCMGPAAVVLSSLKEGGVSVRQIRTVLLSLQRQLGEGQGCRAQDLCVRQARRRLGRSVPLATGFRSIPPQLRHEADPAARQAQGTPPRAALTGRGRPEVV